MPGLRRALVHLALAAFILRAFLPAGWMPDPQGGGTFVICSVNPASHDPASKTDPRAQEACAFAAAAGPAPHSGFIVLAAPELSASTAPRLAAEALAAPHSRFLSAAPRAPPLSA